MIENATLRAIIAWAVGIVIWYLLGLALLAINWLDTLSLWAAALVAAAVAVWVFFGLRKPGSVRVERRLEP